MTTFRYTGGISPLTISFPATGRTLAVERGECVDLLDSEAESLGGRSDFEPSEPPTDEAPRLIGPAIPGDPEDPTPTLTEETPLS